MTALEQPKPLPPLRGNHRFSRLWASHAISNLGTSASLIALPLFAVQYFRGDTLEVGLLMAAQQAAWIVIGLPAGAWVDRLGQRKLMLVCDWVRGALLAVLPGIALLHLPIAYAILVAFLIGVCTVFFTIAYQATLPHEVRQQDLPAANRRLTYTQTGAQVMGLGFAGLMVQFIGPGGALLFNAFCFIASGVLILLIPPRQVDAPPDVPRRPILKEISEGLRYVWQNSRIRALSLVSANVNFFGAMQQAVLVVFLVQEARLAEGVAGALLAAAGIGGVCGAALGHKVNARMGAGEGTIAVMVVGSTLGLLIPLTFSGIGLVLFLVGYVALWGMVIMFSAVSTTYRQAVCPKEMLGRMTATSRFLTWGVLPLGSAIGGGLGSALGERAVLWITAVGFIGCPAWLFFTKARRLPELDTEIRQRHRTRGAFGKIRG
ncbi:MFS transporter [Streptomyces sp. NPDC015350]|uniref:MFS transporter n=1 Tax=Streptomyces sp. NPDC015350 TaxID=3364955 RepID=UPI0036FACBE3